MQKPQFYEDNRYWIVDEVDKYQTKNQNDIKEEQERKRLEDERLKADVIEGEGEVDGEEEDDVIDEE